MSREKSFADRYGAWAVVFGASEGLGAGFVRAVARRGLNVFLVARRADLLEGLAEECRRDFGIEARCLSDDIASRGFVERFLAAVAGLEVGLLVYNAAFAPIGDFIETDPTDLSRVIDVNVRGPTALVRALAPPMVTRGRGAILLMSSLAGNQGGPRLATYAASKAFNRVLAEGLWHELGPAGIDVVACCAGAVRTPGYALASGGDAQGGGSTRGGAKDAPGTLDAGVVAERAVAALGRGPIVVPGFINRLAAFLLGRLLSRRAAIRVMAGSTRGLEPSAERGRRS